MDTPQSIRERSGLQVKLRLLFASLVMALLLAGDLAAQDEEETETPPPTGLAATYVDAAGTKIERHDARLAFRWPGESAPDVRLQPGKFTATWTGRLDTRTTGKYRFHLFAAGQISLKIAGQEAITGASETPRWFDSTPVELPFGEHPLEITFARLGEQAEIGLYWTGPDFTLEPVSSRWLSHSKEHAPQAALFERGQELARGLRCGACHALPSDRALLAAPALDRLTGNVRPEWLLAHLNSPAPRAAEKDRAAESQLPARRMPHFQLKELDAQAIRSYLLSVPSTTAEPLPPEPAAAPPAKNPPAAEKPAPDQAATLDPNQPPTKQPAEPTGPSAERGERLVLSLGCLACHRVGEMGTAGLFSGGELSQIALKRPADFFERWLRAPQTINRDHRMPVYSLSKAERADVALYLAAQKPAAPVAEEKQPPPAAAELIAQGRQLVNKLQCAACHRLPADETRVPLTPRKPWTAETSWAASCISPTAAPAERPLYRLTAEDQQALQTYLTALSAPAIKPALPASEAISAAQLDAAWLLREHNCTACHQRESAAGLAEVVSQVVAKHQAELARFAPAMIPPSLESIGDKLHDAALQRAIQAEHPRRPWLLVRMPRFQFSEEQRKAILNQLIAEDRIPPRPVDESVQPAAPLDPQLVRLAGGRLLTAEGFGCTSCHQVGGVKPVKVELNAMGPELSNISERIRHEWFDRWVRNPTRIVPRMEMPAIKQGVPGVLNHELVPQLAAVWEVLNVPGFTPPEPNPIRTLRRHNVAAYGEPTTWLTDHLEYKDQTFVKPLLLALPNRHNVLFDLERQRLAGWWIGDAARQRTRGKTWYWETAGMHVLPPHPGAADETDLLLVRGEKLIAPTIQADFPPTPDEFHHLQGSGSDGGLMFETRLAFPGESANAPAQQILVRQQFLPVGYTLDNNPRAVTGFARVWEFSGLPAESELQIRALPAQQVAEIDKRRTMAHWDQGIKGKLFIKSPGVQFSPGKDCVVRVRANAAGTARVAINYFTDTPPDKFFMFSRGNEPGPVETLVVAPGWQVQRLGLAGEIMPISLAWRRDGRLLIGSLKNQLFQATDHDGDGLEERLRQIGDEFVQPYGLATQILDDDREVIDVVDKTGLYRLHDDNGDEYFERMETLADGWGRSTDYHGWMVGLPRDEQGSYYAALSQRGGPAAHLRGAVLKLSPRVPTAENPRLFGVEELAWGLRFPAGIARNSAGELFVTDNQGNYNAWNELNQILPGRHFGYIAPEDSKARTAEAKIGPSVALPHPWSRSVNGICFLETPAAVREKLGRNLFGPWEGHLVGCEYDTRRLVRISLHRAGELIEGAAYPLTLTPGPEQDLAQWLLGPVVCQVSPQGDLYVGGIRDSAYGGGNNTGEVVRFRFTGELPPGIAEVRRSKTGLEVDFATVIDPARAALAENYEVISYRRISTPAYGGPDQDRRTEKLEQVEVRNSGQGVTLHVGQLRPGHVYEVRAKNLLPAGELFHPAEAYYSVGPVP